MSASSTTSLGNSSPRAERALPKASRKESLFAINAGAPASYSEVVGELRDMHEILALVLARAQRGQRFFGLCRRQLYAAMPGGDVFHIGHALAFDRVGDDHRWFLPCGAGLAQGFKNLRYVVAVDFRDRPTE